LPTQGTRSLQAKEAREAKLRKVAQTNLPAPVPEASDVAEVGAKKPGEGRVGKKLMAIGTMTDALVGTVTDDAVFIDRIIADVGSARRMRVLVVASASAAPTWLYDYFRTLMPLRGVPVENIALAHIAKYDDEATPDVDESTWIKGAYDPREVAKVADANVVWFEGGDQLRTTELLLGPDGKDSPFLAALRAKLAAKDLIIAGYSAGTAIMSDPMIGRGSAWEALTLPPDPTCDNGLCVVRGLGFLPKSMSIIVDQHFTERGRFPRLIRALAVANAHNGVGVSEFSAWYIDLGTKKSEVVGVPGKAYVTIIGREGARANHEQAGPPFLGDNYTMSILAVGDTYDLPDDRHPHGVAAHPIAADIYEPFSAYYDDNPVGTDALGYESLIEHVAVYFADGAPQASGAARVDTVGLQVSGPGTFDGFRFRFTADEHSSVAWNEDVGYSMFNARVQITTMRAQFMGLDP
jgi:cyanophycinase